MPKTTGGRLIAEMISGYGVTHVFFVPQMMMKTLAELENMPVVRVMTHGEKSAAYMADGYARAARRPGICMAQHVGASNLAAGMRDPFLACSPVIALTGGPAPAARYRHAYQELEDFGQFDKTTKLNAHVDDVKRVPDMFRRAFREAVSGCPGPVHLQLGGHHAEVTNDEADLQLIVEERFKSIPPFRPQADKADVDAALKLLDAARRPIIVAGGGVAWSGAQAEVVALAERLAIPVATSLNAKGTILETHPLAVGVCGVYSRDCANRAVAEADLVFFIGSHTGSQVTTRWQVPKPGVDVIHLDIDAREFGLNYPTRQALLGDARAVLEQMLAASPAAAPGKRADWLARTQALVVEWRASVAQYTDSDAVPMRPERAAKEISKALPEDAVLVSDTGHSGIWTGAYVDFTRKGQRLIRCAGSLGWGMPGAIGVKCALPDRPVICFAGDGGLYYHLAELETAVRHGINLVVIVNNNTALNQEIPHYDHYYPGGKQTEKARELWGFNEVNFARVAEALGCQAIRVERPSEIGPALAKALAAGKPVVIDLVTDTMAFAPRAWTPGGGGH